MRFALLRPIARIIPVIAALVFAACADDSGVDTGPAWTTLVDTLPGGAVRVTNAPPAEGVRTSFHVVEELRIGTMEGGGPASFGELRSLVVTEDGLVAVLDAQSKDVRVFDRDGNHVATHGREGEGPGEYVGPNGLMLAPDGRIWVADPIAQRMSFLDARTGFLNSAPNRQLRRGYVYGGAMMNDGRVLKPSLTLGPPERRDLFRVFGPDMELLDSIFQPEPEPVDPKDPPTSFFWEAPGGMPQGYMSVPFVQRPSAHFHPDGVIWSTAPLADRYHLVSTSWEGDTLRIVETARPAVPIADAVRDSAIARIREQLVEYSGDIGDQSWDKVPRAYPFVERITSDAAGNLWVETGSVDASVWDVYDPDGRYLRTVEIDLRMASWIPPVIRGDEIWAVVLDELDVPYVVRGRVTERTEAGG